MFPKSIESLARLAIANAVDKNLTLATAESCTGGLIAAALTEIPGSSGAFNRGFITYSDNSKRDMLGVPGDIIADLGAVSEPVARSMAEGAVVMGEGDVDIAVAVTGVAGPGGGTALKPVGLVHIACARKGENIVHDVFRFGDIGRSEIRVKTTEQALQMMINMIG
jgi:nicotinamide-nucleotide amidase